MNNKIWLFVAGISLLGMGIFGGRFIGNKPEVKEENKVVVATVTPEVREVTVIKTVTTVLTTPTATPTITPTSTPILTPTATPTSVKLVIPKISIVKIDPNLIKIIPTATPTLVKIVVPTIKIVIPKW